MHSERHPVCLAPSSEKLGTAPKSQRPAVVQQRVVGILVRRSAKIFERLAVVWPELERWVLCCSSSSCLVAKGAFFDRPNAFSIAPWKVANRERRLGGEESGGWFGVISILSAFWQCVVLLYWFYPTVAFCLTLWWERGKGRGECKHVLSCVTCWLTTDLQVSVPHIMAVQRMLISSFPFSSVFLQVTLSASPFFCSLQC